MPHIGGEDEYHDLNKKCDARDKKKALGGELFEDQADHSHDRKLQYRLQEIGIAQFFFCTAEISYDLDHEIVDHVVGEEETDDSDQEKRKGRIGFDEGSERTAPGAAFRIFCAGVWNWFCRFFEGEDQDRGKDHHGDIDVKKDPDAVAFNKAADEGGSDSKACRTEASGKTVHDRAPDLLVFKTKGCHHGLVGELDHVDQGEDREYHELVVFREKKNG